MKGACLLPRRMDGRMVLAALAVILMMALAIGGRTPAGAAEVPAKYLHVGRSELLDVQNVQRLAVSDPAVIDYVVLSKKQVMLVAKKAGEGDLFVWDSTGRRTFHIVVTSPPARQPEVIAAIQQAIDRPAVAVSAYNDVIILEGEVGNTEEAKRAETIARAYVPKVENLIRVLGVPPVDQGTVSTSPPVEKSLPVGGSMLLDFSGIGRVTISDPALLDSIELSKIQLMLVGKKAGEANVFVWDKVGPHLFHVTITPLPSKIPELVAKIKQAINRPAVSVNGYNEAIVLEGEVENTDEVKRAEVIARAYTSDVTNLLRFRTVPVRPLFDLAEIRRVMGTGIRITEVAEGVLLFEGVATPEERARLDQIVRAVGGRVSVIDMVTTAAVRPRQVLVRVKAVEVNRNSLRELGIDWGGLNAGGAHDQPILFGEESTGPFALDEFGPIRRLEGISARLKALTTEGRARILAEPNLLVVEGQLAEILVGGEIPIPVVQTLGTSTGSVSVEWKEFGVKLAIKPVISTDGQSINLDVAPEVSNLDFANSVVISNIRLPALQTRRAHSVLQILNGRTLVIGGLYQADQSRVRRKIPLLGDIPLVGNLFRRTDRTNIETELVVFVTPEIVTDVAAAARTETDMSRMGVTNDARINIPR